jgi:hypothetical protein
MQECRNSGKCQIPYGIRHSGSWSWSWSWNWNFEQESCCQKQNPAFFWHDIPSVTPRYDGNAGIVSEGGVSIIPSGTEIHRKRPQRVLHEAMVAR